MKPSGIISLLTDFGNADGYVAAMKAVILTIHPQARLIDISHDVAPQDVQAGAFLLSSHSKFFPAGTVHLAVVDPGVGTARRLLAVQAGEQIYLAPDNGLLDFCIDLSADQTVEINNKNLWRHSVAKTFHGRDILSPVAAHISAGMPLSQVGSPTKLVRRMSKPVCSMSDKEIIGQVVYIDRFGNLITNLPARYLHELGNAANFEIYLEEYLIGALCSTYADVEEGTAVAVVGGFDLLEIGINGGSAVKHFRAGVGAVVTVRKK